jgi:hypothetical protein
MALSGGVITMIFMNVVLALGILAIVLLGFSYQKALTTCESTPSDLCYQIQCPCDNDQSSGPCFGFASRQIGIDRYICSNAPLAVVNGSGNIV